MVANHRKWGLSVPYSTISVFSFQSCGLTIISIGSYIVNGETSHITIANPSDHGQFRNGETQTRASHKIYHDPKDFLAPGVILRRSHDEILETREYGGRLKHGVPVCIHKNIELMEFFKNKSRVYYCYRLLSRPLHRDFFETRPKASHHSHSNS
ncbi:hypothetical protein LXL04_015254 [Taraxacum kok-saghyz]